MTEQPKPTQPRFRPALPIVVESTSKGECRVRTTGGVFGGPTLREAIDAATKLAESMLKD